ncbi:MAG: class I SAM-dependent methyltransferase [Thermoplasmatota archaeon]
MTREERPASVGEFRSIVRASSDKQAAALTGRAFYDDEVRARRLVQFAGTPPAARILDVGCGAGPVLSHLVLRGARAVGVDLSRTMLRHARATGAAVALALGESLPFKDASCDLVIARSTLHHVPAPDAAVRDMRRVLVPGGALVVEDVISNVVPDASIRHNEVERLRDPSHSRFLSVSALTGLFEENGFEISELEVVTHPRELEEWLASAEGTHASRDVLRDRFRRDVAEQRLGLHTRLADGLVRFELRHALVKGIKR